MSTAYARRKAARERQREVAVLGETLAAFHARETARPPTLSEVYARNHTNRERCPWTADLEVLCSSTRRSKARSTPHQVVHTTTATGKAGKPTSL